MRTNSLLALLMTASLGCTTPSDSPSFVVILLDDVGNDKISAYGEHPDTPDTPAIDGLAADGVLYRNAYATPVCSPGRAGLLTGRHGRHYGVGAVVHHSGDQEVSDQEWFIPEVLELADAPYSSAVTGKWHLAGTDSKHAWDHPTKVAGFDHYRGSFANLSLMTTTKGIGDYFRWEKVTDGKRDLVEHYAVSETVDDAIEQLETLRPPFLLVVSLQAAHGPWHVPPASLLRRDIDADAGVAEMYDASVEAADAEVGRFLAAMTDEQNASTTVFLTSDNGTNKVGIRAPLDPEHGKGSMYEGGINVPLIVRGPDVVDPGRETEALAHVVDLLPTVAEMASVDLALIEEEGHRFDGFSLVPVLEWGDEQGDRETVYTERFKCHSRSCSEDERVVRDERYKLIRRLDQEDELYDLLGRDDDGPDLLHHPEPLLNSERDAYLRLSAELDRYADQLR